MNARKAQRIAQMGLLQAAAQQRRQEMRREEEEMELRFLQLVALAAHGSDRVLDEEEARFLRFYASTNRRDLTYEKNKARSRKDAVPGHLLVARDRYAEVLLFLGSGLVPEVDPRFSELYREAKELARTLGKDLAAGIQYVKLVFQWVVGETVESEVRRLATVLGKEPNVDREVVLAFKAEHGINHG